MRLVLIEWVDSAQPATGWTWIEEGYWDDPVLCRSVGWLIHDGQKVKALAQSLGETGGHLQVSAVIKIPTCAVQRVVSLTPETVDCASCASREPLRQSLAVFRAGLSSTR